MAINGKSIAYLQSVTCDMGSHLAKVNAHRLTPARQTGVVKNSSHRKIFSHTQQYGLGLRLRIGLNSGLGLGLGVGLRLGFGLGLGLRLGLRLGLVLALVTL